MEIALLFAGLLVGGIIGYLFVNMRFQKDYISNNELENKYVSKDAYNNIKSEFEEIKSDAKAKNDSIITLNQQLTKLEGEKNSLNEKLGLINKELEDLHKKSELQFENLANKIFDAKKKTFNDDILDPFKKDIKEFKEKIEGTRKEDIKDITSLKKEIEQLHTLNIKLHDDAQALSMALKADVKTQGGWGEDILKVILDIEGFQENVHYTTQASYQNEEGAWLRPDLIFLLPDNKQIIIDSKVSLKAYTDYFSAPTSEEKSGYLQEHVKSIKNHIDNLAKKAYQALPDLNTPDYVFLFMPIESALTLALNEDANIITKATQQKIVLVTPVTLIAALKIIKLLWLKEKQVKNIEEIYKESGSLYEKFVGFLEDMEGLKKGLDNANKAYEGAMNKLTTGRGNIVKKAESLKQLGAKINKDKSIPASILEKAEISNDNVNIKVIETEYFENVKEEL